MAYDKGLAERVREITGDHPGASEKKMFGGLCFLVNGNMACGVEGDSLMLRLGNELAADALKEPHTRPMDFTGRVIKTMLYVSPSGLETDEQLSDWVGRALQFAESLPPK